MSNSSGLIFGAVNLSRADISGKRVLEVGARNVNGSLRPLIEAAEPARYIGVDIEPGEGVDVICNAEDLLNRFGADSFDLVISTELLEHIKDWRKAVSNIKGVVRPGGPILLTTRSIGFKYHGYPSDYWRYEQEDMLSIFDDFDIEKIEKDRDAPGVFVIARKPVDFRERDLSDYQLFSIITGARTKDISPEDIKKFMRRYTYGHLLRKRAENFMKKIIWFGSDRS